MPLIRPIAFTASDHIINDLLPGPINDFRLQHKNVIPSIHVGTPDEIIDLLLTTECEFALMFAKVNAPQMEYRRLFFNIDKQFKKAKFP